MKKVLYLFAAAMIMSSCSSVMPDADNSINDGSIADKPGVDAISHPFSNGSSITLASMSGKKAPSRAASDLTWEAITLDMLSAEEKQEILDMNIGLYPEATKNIDKDYSETLDNFANSFLYKSTGCAYNVMLLYTCYCNHTGDEIRLFWLDEDGTFNPENTLSIWKETATGTNLAAKRSPKYNINADNSAVQFTLPEGTIFGFYFYNSYEGKKGTKHFTYRDLNTTCNPDEDPAKCDVNSMITYTYDGYQIIGMDATFPVSSSYDADLNDIVFMITPIPSLEDEPENTPIIVPEPEPKPTPTPEVPDIIIPVLEVDHYIFCEADDFCLSNNVERYPEYYNIGADPNRKINVDKGNTLVVKIDDIDKLQYDEQYKEWTFEAWVWLSEVPAEEKYLIGKEEEPDWETYSNDYYRIGVSSYMGIGGHEDIGYIHTSVHIQKK